MRRDPVYSYLGEQHHGIIDPHVHDDVGDLVLRLRTPRVKVQHELRVDRLQRVNVGRDDVLREGGHERREGAELLFWRERDVRS